MYYLEKKGFGPFKKNVLMCEPYKNAKPFEVKDIHEIAPNLDIEKGANGLMRLITSKDSTNNDIYEFDIYNGVVTFFNKNGECGFITKNDRIIGNDLGMSVISKVDVLGDTIIVEQVHKKSHHANYIALSSLDGNKISNQLFENYTHGDIDKCIRGGLIFLTQTDSLKSIITTTGHMLATDCFKYDISRNNLVTLSRTRKGPEKTWLDCIALPKNKSPKFTLSVPDVTDFDLNVDELITKSENESCVYTLQDLTKDQAVEPLKLKFSAKGEIRDITPSFYGEKKYLNSIRESKRLLNDDGSVAENIDLRGLIDVKYADDESYITTIKNQFGTYQGLIRTSDFGTIIPPRYEKVRKFGKNEVIATYGDSFAVYGLVQEEGSHAYSTYTTEIIPMNNYFYPQLTNKESTLLCRDSNDMDCVLVAKHGKAKIKALPNYGRDEMDLEEYIIPRNDFQHEDESSLGLPTQDK